MLKFLVQSMLVTILRALPVEQVVAAAMEKLLEWFRKRTKNDEIYETANTILRRCGESIAAATIAIEDESGRGEAAERLVHAWASAEPTPVADEAVAFPEV